MYYTLFMWHVLTHRVPALWRFHRVHHLDLDLSATTALRFHFVEMALSVPWRARSSLGDWSIAPLLVGLANWPAGFHSVSPLQCPFAYVVGAFAGQDHRYAPDA